MGQSQEEDRVAVLRGKEGEMDIRDQMFLRVGTCTGGRERSIQKRRERAGLQLSSRLFPSTLRGEGSKAGIPADDPVGWHFPTVLCLSPSLSITILSPGPTTSETAD